ncbi:MAG: RdgB/HAM1 family non-canonical purine NTP pyrophosphatase [Deltaproteobacteria bacterium]|jgi:XTP/dITP diphosphohydrolase|nr:RdgB/HAM1 family non-canonical purine NTP pyrophosphatase [Deltaproteobacteria bacterium]
MPNLPILLATSNPGKIRELGAILKPLNLTLLTLADLKDQYPPPAETGADFLANALLKARYYSDQSHLPALADDSGLEVKALNGEPGVHSARYGGEDLGDLKRSAYLLKKMANIADRKARFRAVLALAYKGQSLTWSGELVGEIALEAKGENGFGYDPIFIEPQSGLTLAQMPLEAKNRISHRARAGEALSLDLAKIAAFLGQFSQG